MIYLALTPSGLAHALRQAAQDDSIWCACGAIAAEDFSASPPLRVTRLDYPLDGEDSIRRALWTIGDHHPGESVWVESVPPGPTI